MTKTQSPLDLQVEEVDLGSRAEISQASPVAVSQRAFQPNTEIAASSRDTSLSLQSGLLMTDAQLRAENAALQSEIESLRALLPLTSPNSQLQVLRSRIESLQNQPQPTRPSTAAWAANPQFLTEMAALRSEIELLRTSLALSPPPYISQ
jgi:hypothetical protein